MNAKNIELEVRFIKIDKPSLLKKLRELGAKDLGEDLLRELIFDNKARTFNSERKLIRIRTTRKGSTLTFKDHRKVSYKVPEIEFGIEDPDKAAQFLRKLGYKDVRRQEKRRHKFQLEGCTIDIDTWPGVDPYVEVEGPSKDSIKRVSEKLGFNWGEVIYEDAKRVLEKYYHIPVSKLKNFTFKS